MFFILLRLDGSAPLSYLVPPFVALLCFNYIMVQHYFHVRKPSLLFQSEKPSAVKELGLLGTEHTLHMNQ